MIFTAIACPDVNPQICLKEPSKEECGLKIEYKHNYAVSQYQPQLLCLLSRVLCSSLTYMVLLTWLPIHKSSPGSPNPVAYSLQVRSKSTVLF